MTEKDMTQNDKCATTEEETPVVICQQEPQTDGMNEAAKERERAENYLDSLKHMQADFENYRKRMAEVSRTAREDGQREVLEKLLPVLDAFTEAKRVITDQSVLSGIDLIFDRLSDAMSRFAIKQIDAMWQEFDPRYHEAVAMKDDDTNSGKIVEVFQNGYMLGTRVLRPAKVIVAK